MSNIYAVAIGETTTMVKSIFDIHYVSEYYRNHVSVEAVVTKWHAIDIDWRITESKPEPEPEPPLRRIREWEGQLVYPSKELRALQQEMDNLGAKIKKMMEAEAEAGAKVEFGGVANHVSNLHISGGYIAGTVVFAGCFFESRT